MDIIYECLPEINDEVDLIIEPIIINNNKENLPFIIDQNKEVQKDIIINQNKYQFNNIYTNIEKETFLNLITNGINIKNNISLILLLNNNKEEENDNSNNYNFGIRNIIKNFFNKDIIDKLNIKNMKYNYYIINLEINQNENIIKDKYINDESNYTIDIPIDENNINISLLRIEIEYSDLNISSFVQLLFIYNSFEKIIPLFALNKKENELQLLKEKINFLLIMEKDIKDKINNLPIINNEYLNNVRSYESEVINYYNNFINSFKNIDNKENKEKTGKNNKDKNNINESIKEAKNLLNSINNEQFRQREKDIYEKYIQVYSDINKNEENYNNQELKKVINTFNNINEELMEAIENINNNKNSGNDDKKKNEREIEELKEKINQLEKELKEEKDKNSHSNNNDKDNEKKVKHRNSSASKVGMQKESKISTIVNNNNSRLEEENRNLKKKIEELKEIISKLKSSNESLFKTNEKLIKEKNSLKTELLKEKNNNMNSSGRGNNNISSLDNLLQNELFNSPSKQTNKSNYNTSNKKTKKMNKNKTSMEPLFNGNSLLLLKKIQDENRELARKLNDFNSKNFQLELSIKGINTGDINNNLKNSSSTNSMLSHFTNSTRDQLKNIEKKYGLSKK